MKNLINHRNHIRQVIRLADGSEKVIWHEKKQHASQFQDYKSLWNEVNRSPKPNSKRQKLLRELNPTIDNA